MPAIPDPALAPLVGSWRLISIYSGIATLAPGKVYMLGYNPGGDPEAENDSP